METKENIFEAIILVIAVVATIFGVMKYNGNETNNGNAPETENVAGNEVFYVPCVAVRSIDYVTVEYYGNTYDAYVDPESEIQTGDYVWAGFYIDGNELRFVHLKPAYAFHQKGEQK